MKNFKSYEFQRTDSNKPYMPRNGDPLTDNFTFQNNSTGSLNQNLLSKDYYENRINQLESRVNELEKSLRFFEDYFKLKSVYNQLPQKNNNFDEVTQDIYNRINLLENKILNYQNLYRQYDIEQIVLDKFTPLKLSVNQNINEIKIVDNELSECNLRQDNQFKAIKENISKINNSIDTNTAKINDMNVKIGNILDVIGDSTEEELFLRNIRNK